MHPGVLHRVETLLLAHFSAPELYAVVRSLEAGRELLENVRRYEWTPLAQWVAEVVEAAERRSILGLLVDQAATERPEVEALCALRVEVPRGASARPARTPFVGRAGELGRLVSELEDGRSTLLIGGRRAGKTSLVMQLRIPGRSVILADAGAWRVESEALAVQGLAESIGAAEASRRSVLERLRASGPCVVVLDEADRLLGFPWTSTFFAWLRSLNETELRSRAPFLLIGGPALRRYRDPAYQGSPVLNNAQPVFVEPLSMEAREELVSGMAPGVDRAALYREVGSHPWLLVETLRGLATGQALDQALMGVEEGAQSNFETWREQLGSEGRALLTDLPEEGVPLEEFGYKRAWRQRFPDGWPTVRAMCLVEMHGGRVFRGARMFGVER